MGSHQCDTVWTHHPDPVGHHASVLGEESLHLSALPLGGFRLCSPEFIHPERAPATFLHHHREPQQPGAHILGVHRPAERHSGSCGVSPSPVSPCPEGGVIPLPDLLLLRDCFKPSFSLRVWVLSVSRGDVLAAFPISHVGKLKLRNGSIVPKVTQCVRGRARI